MSRATVKLFNGTLAMEVEGKDLKEMVEQLSFYSQIPDVCPKCGGRIGFTYREPQGYSYWGLACENGHSTNFGVYKEEGRGLYYKHEEWEKWVDGKKVEEQTPTAETKPAAQQPKPQPQQPPAPQTAATKPPGQTNPSSSSSQQDTPTADYMLALKKLGVAYKELGVEDGATKKAWSLYIAGVTEFGSKIFTVEKINAVLASLQQIRAGVPQELPSDKLAQIMRDTAAEGGDVAIMIESLPLVVGEVAVKKQKAQAKKS